MEGFLTSLGKGVSVVLTTALICAVWVIGHRVFCHGGGQRCGEAVLESLLYTMAASPIILILVTLCFFPSQWKAVLATLAILAAGALASFGLTATIEHLPPVADEHPEKAEKWQAAFRYKLCLEVTAQTVAKTSNDPQLAIWQTSLARCEKERQEIFDTFRKHADTVSPAAMGDLQQKFWSKLPQIIAKARG